MNTLELLCVNANTRDLRKSKASGVTKYPTLSLSSLSWLKLRTINTWASYLVQSVFYPKWFVSLRASKIRKRGFRVRETILSIHGFLWYDNTRRWAILQPPKNWNISEFKRKHSETLCQRNISTDQWFTIDLEVIIINIISTISCGIFGKIYFSTL